MWGPKISHENIHGIPLAHPWYITPRAPSPSQYLIPIIIPQNTCNIITRQLFHDPQNMFLRLHSHFQLAPRFPFSRFRTMPKYQVTCLPLDTIIYIAATESACTVTFSFV